MLGLAAALPAPQGSSAPAPVVAFLLEGLVPPGGQMQGGHRAARVTGTEHGCMESTVSSRSLRLLSPPDLPPQPLGICEEVWGQPCVSIDCCLQQRLQMLPPC